VREHAERSTVDVLVECLRASETLLIFMATLSGISNQRTVPDQRGPDRREKNLRRVRRYVGMMVRLEASRSFAIGRAAAFDYITNPGNWPQYWPGLVAVATPSAPWLRPGDAMVLRMRLNGREVDLHMTLDRMERPALVAYRSVQRGLPDTSHERHFELVGDGFRYRLAVSYEPRSGFAGLLDRTLVKRGISRALRRTLDNLAVRLVPDQGVNVAR
jgi:hypothetical protein